MPQSSVLGQLPFNIFTKDGEECQCALSKFADDKKLLDRPVTTLEDRAAIHEHLGRLGQWMNRRDGRSSVGGPIADKKESLEGV